MRHCAPLRVDEVVRFAIQCARFIGWRITRPLDLLREGLVVEDDVRAALDASLSEPATKLLAQGASYQSYAGGLLRQDALLGKTLRPEASEGLKRGCTAQGDPADPAGEAMSDHQQREAHTCLIIRYRV